MALKVDTDRLVLEENINKFKGRKDKSVLYWFTPSFLPIFFSIPAATAAKLGMKLGAGVSGLWHASLWYKLFMLKRSDKTHKQMSKLKSVLAKIVENITRFYKSRHNFLPLD